jgi:hypothetical protein
LTAAPACSARAAYAFGQKLASDHLTPGPGTRVRAVRVAPFGLPLPTWFTTLRDNRVVDGTACFDSIAFDELWTRVKP